MKYKYILFDLDGTISESAEGIRMSLEHMIKETGVPMVDLSDYTKYIGPPLLDTIKNLCKIPEEKWDEAYTLYKNYYDQKGRFTNKPYDGIEEVLTKLREKGVKLAVCTSKLEEVAHVVMKELGLFDYFDAVCGSNRESTRKDKKDLIPYAVETLGGTLPEAVMLGDTRYDAKGAMECNVDFIACSYGYGTDEEMAKYNPVAWAESPLDILEKLN